MYRGRHEGHGGMLIGLVCIILFCSLVLMLAGFAAPYWIERQTTDGTNDTTIYRGLWVHCVEIGNADADCEMTIDTSEDTWYRVCQGMAILVLVAMVFSFAFFIYWCCSYGRYYFNKVLVICVLALAGCMAIATSIVYGIEYDSDFDDYDLKWAFYCYCICGPLVIMAIPVIMLIPSFELQPTWRGPWYRRIYAPRYRQSVVQRAPVMIPTVAPANVIPQPAPLVPGALVPQNAYQPPRPPVVQQPPTGGNKRSGGGGFNWVRNR